MEDIALQSSKVLLLDHHTEIFIWFGKNQSEYTEKHLQIANNMAIERAQYRFPQPYIMQFKVSTNSFFYCKFKLIINNLF